MSLANLLHCETADRGYMTRVHLRHLLRMEKLVAQLRVTAVVLTGAVLLNAYGAPVVATGRGLWMMTAWGAGLLYALTVVWAEPYRHLPLVGWEIGSGLLDWSFITLAIAATGMEHSD